MTLSISLELETFFNELYQRFQALQNDTLARFRAKSWEHFKSLGLPTRQSEVFQYVRLRQLYEKKFAIQPSLTISKATIAQYIYPDCEKSVIVLVDGEFSKELSNFDSLPAKTMVMPLEEAMRTFGSLLQNQMQRMIQDEKDPFCTLNGALSKTPVFIYIPPKAIVEFPIQILQVYTASQGLYSPRIEFYLGALSELNVLNTVAYLDPRETIVNHVISFSLDEGARVTFTKLYNQAPENCWQFDATRAFLKKDSTFHSTIIQEGMYSLRDDYRVQLLGSNSEIYLAGIALLSDKRESHTHVLVDHQAPECRSMQFFKAVLEDTSKASFEGKIYVHHEAQKTQAFQLNNNLLLSDYAQAFSKPNLEIFADDVKASHGATVGQLDAESLFYLTSRGLPKAIAKNLLIQGFCYDILEKIPKGDWAEEAKKISIKYLS